jgi:Flp pilus assembly protein TadG
MAMVETVIVLPALLMVLFAIIELGIVFGRWQALSNAAREGARLAILFRTGCSVATVEADVAARVEQYAATVGIAPADLSVEVVGACGDRDTTTRVTVRSDYDFRVLPSFAERLEPSLEVVASSEMRNEGSG